MLRLVSPDHAHLPGYLAALQSGWSPNSTRDVSGEHLAQIAEDADHFLRMQRGETGSTVTLADGRMVERLPGAVFWLWDGAFCGMINLRYQPGTEALPAHVSGHVGYGVVPGKRGRGYATEALRQLLPIARQLGLRRVALTCDAGNLPSCRVIVANGGHPAPSEEPGKLLFWIDLTGERAMPEVPQLELPKLIEVAIAAWGGITPPNDPARRMAADLASVIAGFEALRGTLVFEDEPASFTAALQAAKEA